MIETIKQLLQCRFSTSKRLSFTPITGRDDQPGGLAHAVGYLGQPRGAGRVGHRQANVGLVGGQEQL